MDRKIECSFCGKTNDETAGLIAGPAKHGHARICAECVGLCQESMDPERMRARKEDPRTVYRVSQATDRKPSSSCSFCGARLGRGGVQKLAGAPKANFALAICEACAEKAKAIAKRPPEAHRAVQLIHLIAQKLRLRPAGMRWVR